MDQRRLKIRYFTETFENENKTDKKNQRKV